MPCSHDARKNQKIDSNKFKFPHIRIAVEGTSKRLFGGILFLVISFSCSTLSAQEMLNSTRYSLYRALQLTNQAEGYTGNIYSYSTAKWTLPRNSQWKDFAERRKDTIYAKNDFELFLSNNTMRYSFNSTLPYGVYDGAQWQGKGSNIYLNLGLAMRWKGLMINLEGESWFAGNSDFAPIPVDVKTDYYVMDEFPDKHQYWYYGGGAIDYYQHPTSANVLQFGLGQSVIRYSGNHWTVGFSTENIWVGPSRFFPVLFSNQSEGFPHFDIGTLGYVPVRIKKTELGLIDARAVLGYTRESDYYDDDSSNDFTQNILFSLGYALPKLKGLKLGFNYLMKKNMPNFTSNIWQLFDPSYAIFSRNTREATDGMISLTASWRFPKVGLEIYGEYARNDFTVTIGTYQISRIDHAKGYTIGLEKVFKLKTGKLFGVVLEFSDLMTVPYTNRANEPIWYKHFSVPQGHTHRGQLLGSPIGPASDSQILAMALYDTRVAWEWWIQRISVDNDYVYELSIMDEPYNRDYNYAILVAGIRWTQFNRFFDWYLEATGSLHLNYGYERDNDLGNIYLGAGLSY